MRYATTPRGVSVTDMEIAPRQFGDSLDAWFRLLGRNWRALLLSSLMVHIPLGVVVMFLFWMTGAAEHFELYVDPRLEELPAEEIIEALIPLMWTVGIWTVLQIPAGVFVYLAAVRTVAGDTADTPFATGDVGRFAALRTSTGVAWALLVVVASLFLVGATGAIGWALIAAGGANFLTVFVTTVAALTALIVLIWLGLSLSFGLAVIAVEGPGIAHAVTRSFTLVQGRWWITLCFVALTGIIVSVASQVISVVLIPVFLVGVFVPEVLALGFGVSVALQGPVLAATAAAYAIWYIDLRARRETLLADQLV